jgi:sortase A
MNPNDPHTFHLPDDQGNDDAANLIRSKLDSLYAGEPEAVAEAIESVRPGKHSKHQKFMADLASSGKSFAVIQTEWHEYYQSLPDKEKHEVWNEFYSAQESSKPAFQSTVQPKMIDPSAGAFSGSIEVPKVNRSKRGRPDSVAEIKQQLSSKVKTRGKLSRKQHAKSLLFGLSIGALFIMLLSFGFFNERIIAPFITPSKNVSGTPLIGSASVGEDPKLIIPKINVEVPVVYDVQTIEEDDVQAGLERGVVHYVTTSNPGEKGNGAIFGHSSNNILNKGKYKFAFVLLNRLENDDTFYIEKDGKRFVYKVYDRKIVSPEEVSVLSDVPGKDSTMALITCDPPGTAIKRLVVWGEQISPDPNGNIASTALKTDDTPNKLAGNAESLWSRMWNSVF